MSPFIAAMLSVAILTVPTFIYYAVEARRARHPAHAPGTARGVNGRDRS